MIKLGAHDEWTKSSYSTGNGACVEVKSTEPSAVRVSDSKFTTGTRPEFKAGPAAFAAFVASVRA
jgi:uncharacterized protein DUF397